MFTGIVEKTQRIVSVTDGGSFRRLGLAPGWPEVRGGQSIAVNGCCLTVAEIKGEMLYFDVILETLDKTNLGLLGEGDTVNLERAMKIGDRFDGHFVQGHVDGRATLLNVKNTPEEWRLTIEAPDHLAQYIVPKGSVAIDGVSLTVAAVQGAHFQVALIPTTLSLTTLGDRPPGWQFNLEADVLTKTIVGWLVRQQDSLQAILRR